MSKMFILLAAIFMFQVAVQKAEAQSVTIRGVRLTGNGCNDSTASAAVTADGKILSLIFDNYGVEIGEGTKNPNARSMQRNCRIMIDVNVPAGFQYALEQTDYRGFVSLPTTAHGFHRFTQNIPGEPVPGMREAQLMGPITQNYEVSVRQKPGRLTYSRCNAGQDTIDLMSQLMVQYLPGKQTSRELAMINLDTIDTQVASSFVLSWRRCP